MHTYKKVEAGLYTVGHYQTIGHEEASSEQKWVPMRDFGDEQKAAAFANYLNGGDGDRLSISWCLDAKR